MLVLSPVFADNKQDKTEYAASYNPQEVGKSSYDRVDSPLGFCGKQTWCSILAPIFYPPAVDIL